MNPSPDVLRVGVIGTGVMGADHAHNLARRTGRGPERRRRRRHRQGAQPRGRHGRRARPRRRRRDDRLRPGRRRHHRRARPLPRPLVDACLDAGLPVLCEKPLTPTVEEAVRLIRKHDALPRPLLTVGFMRRFDPSYRAMRERLRSGSEGALLMTHSCHRNVEAYPGQDSSATVTNSAVHEIDVLPWLAGSPIVEVRWLSGRPSSLIEERVDPQLLLMRAADGVLHTVELQVHARYGYDVRCELVCESGSIEMPSVPALLEAEEYVVSSGLARRAAYPADWRPRFAAAYRAELSAWVEATLAGRLPQEAATARDSLRTTVVAEALVTSMKQDGARVAVPSLESVMAEEG